MISVLILTLNEEINLQACIDSIPWRDDVHVLDSGSTDRTLEIARSLGANVHTRPFDTYARQRNHGLALPFVHPWVLMIDADERLSPELADEIARRLPNVDESVAGFRVRRKDMLMGRWLRRSSGYPTWFPRLFRKGRISVKRDINEEYEVDGQYEELREHLIHLPFNKGMEWWFARHNRYSTMEAATLTSELHTRPFSLRGLFARDPLARRASMKQLAYRLPARSALIFLYLYVLRFGFLDGKPGLAFASMRFCYETMISTKLQEAGCRTEPDASDAARQALPPREAA